MLHPFMPFVTEEIYNMLPIKDNDSIMISEYPKYNKENIFETEKIEIDESDKKCDYRNENGDFSYLEQIMEVEGIGQSIFNKVKDQICL